MFAASKSGRAVAATATDPYFKYVPLLLETTSTNGQQNNTFLDSSTNNFTITRNGTPTQGSVTPYWPNGYWSNNFNGSSDYLTTPANAAFAFGTGDFTIEAWVNTNSSATQRIVSAANGSGQPYEFLMVNSGSNIYLNFFDGTTDTGTGTNYVTQNQWVHVAVSRQGTALKVFINGTVYGTSTNNTNLTNAGVLTIGRYSPSAANYFSGYISNLRIVKGVAVYTGNFTPPTTPLAATQSAGTNISAITGTATSLLTCQSNRFIDNSSNNRTITVVSTPKVQAFQPFSPPASYTAAAYGGSGYFNGSSDYLDAGSSTAFVMGSGDWTVESWVYPTSTSVGHWMYLQGNASAFAAIRIGCQSNQVFLLISTNGTTFTISSGLVGTVPINSWTHLAVTRSGTTVTLYVNGTSIYTSTALSTSALMTGTYNLVGRIDPTNLQYFTGYVSNLRLVKGTAVYTANFTPPTTPLTAITNTSLLLNFTNAGIYDAAAQNNAITVGSAQASTTVAKWSPTSMKFNGTTDYLNPPSNPAFAFGTGDFTLECWIYATAASDSAIYEGRASGTGATGFTLTAFSSSVIRVFTNGTAIISSSGTTYLNQWTYVAVVRASGTTTLYINGSSVGTSAGMGNLTDTTPLVGAGRYTGLTTPSSFFTGYIQDFRITKGIARTITTPTAAFPTR